MDQRQLMKYRLMNWDRQIANVAEINMFVGGNPLLIGTVV